MGRWPLLAKNQTFGESGIRRTHLARAFVKDKNLNALVVNHKEDLQKLNRLYGAIVFGDTNLHEIERSQLLAWHDNSEDKTLRVLYKTVEKRKHLVQIITINFKALQQMKKTLLEKKEQFFTTLENLL